LNTILNEAGCDKKKKTDTLVKKCASITQYFANERELRKTEFAS
jgi:hypothetical protein